MKTRSNNQSRTTTWAAKIAKALGLAGLLSATTLAQSTPSEVVSGATGSAPSSYVAMGGNIYFVATNAANGTELWKWDGTSASLAADINSGAGSSDPSGLTVFNNELLFSATDGTNGRELWKFDGTTASMVSNINAGAGDSDPQYLTEYNGNLYFSASNGSYTGAGGPVGRELWKYNGTTSSLVKDIYAGGVGSFGITNEGDPKNFVVATVSSGTYLFFQATTADGIELWRSTGTTAGTVLVKNIYTGSTGLPPVVNSSSPENLTAFNGELVFTATTADGTELWKSNGTSAGTVMVSNLAAGSASSSPAYLKVLDASTLLFAANDGTNGTELWKYDGSTMSLVKDIRSGAASSGPANLHIWNGMALFAANDGTNGNELWKSDGTAAGTVLVKDINAGSASSNPNGFTSVTTFCTDGVIFGATTAAAGLEPWRTGGSTASTKLVQDIRSGATGSMTSPASFVSDGLNIIFTANNGSTGTEPFILKSWIFDETAPTVTCPSGTSAVANGSCQSSIPDYCAPATAADNCNVVTRAQSPAVGAVANLGANPITVTITDENGNSASCSATFTVVDSTAPSITAPAAIAQNNNSGFCYATVSLGSATTSDNCSVSSTVNNAPATFPVGTTSVVWTVTDGSGNTNAASQSVVITDNQDPSITAPAAATAVVDAGICTSTSVVLGSATTGDNCSVLSVSNNGSSPYALGNTTVTWTVFDVNGRSKTATQLVTVTDNQDPSITAPSAVSVNADLGACSASPALGSASTSDNCSVTSVSNNGSAPYAVGTTTVVWTVVDGSGRSKTANQSVTVIDNQNPTITAPAGITTVTAPSSCTAAPALGTPVTTDNCSVSSTVNNAPAAFAVGSTTVVWTVTDGSGRTAVANQIVAVSDNQNPTISAPADVNANADQGSCSAAVVVLGSPVTADNCAVSATSNNGSAPYAVGSTTVTWTVTDVNGLSASATQLVIIADTQNPTISAPATVNAVTDVGICTASGVVLGSPITTDNCGVSGTVNSGTATYALGSTTVTWTVTDVNGRTASATQLVIVADNQNPTITAPAGITTVTAPSSCTAAPALGTPVTTDNCSVSSTVNNAPAAFAVGSTTVVWTVTDGSGRTAVANQIVAVSDNQNPTITAPADVNANADQGACSAAVVVLGSPVTADNCAVSATSNNGSAPYAVGSTTVTWTVTDVNGLSASATQLVIIADTQNPTISAPATVNAVTDVGICTASGVVLGSPITTDNCGVSGTVNSGTATYALGSTTVTWTVTDVNGRTASATQLVIVADNQNPTITAPAGITTVTAPSSCTAAPALGTPVTTDNCSVSSTVNNAPAAFAVGSTTVIWTVTDGSGRTAVANQIVAVSDNQNPTITAPADVNANADQGACSAAVVVLGSPVTADNCAVSATSNNGSAPYAVGSTTVTWTVTDVNGLSASATQLVIIADNQNPTISAPATVNAVTDVGICTASGVVLGSPITTDNCGVSGTVNSGTATYALGSTTVTWTVTDVNGRTASATQLVIVADNQNPTITAPAGITTVTAPSSCTAAPALGTPVTTDNCSVSSTVNNAPAAFAVGSTTVVWTVTDGSGRTAVANQIVAVSDNQNPTITAPADVNANADQGACSAAVVVLGSPVTADNCAVSATSNNGSAPYAVGSTTVTWTVTDVNGLSASATQLVIIADTQNPTISAPATVNAVTDVGICTASGVVLGSPITTDNCGVSGTVNSGTATYALGSTTVTWTVTDVNGRTASAAQLVIVADNQNPTITAPAGITTVTASGLCTAAPALGTPVTTDNCSVSSTVNNAPAAFAVGSTTVIWTVTDGSGRTAVANQIVAVSDNQIPTITAPADVNANADQGACSAAVVVLGSPVTADNCAVSATSNNGSAPYAVGSTTVTWTVTDVNGLSASATQLVIIADTQNPTISAPATVNAVTDVGICTASGVVLGSATTTDNCGVSGTVNSGTATYALGSTTVTWTVTDVNGRTASATQLVIVADNQNPTITAPSGITTVTAPSICTAAPALGTPVTTDNCSVSSTVNNAPAAFAVGSTTVVWTVTDGSGRTAVANQIVAVSDNQNPTISAPANKSVNNDAGLCTAVVSLGSPSTDDNCGVSGSATNNAPAAFPVGTTSVTWTVLDIYGNSNTAAQSVVVADAEAPSISAPANKSVNADSGVCFASGVALGSPSTNDNCGVSGSATNNAPATFPVGTTSVTWTVLDIHGNSNTAAQSVIVADNQNPTITAPADVTANTGAGICTVALASLGTPVTADNCAVSTTVNNAPASFPMGVTTVVWTVTDVNGRSAVANQSVSIIDRQAPSITAPAAVILSSDAGSCAKANPAIGSATATDNCGVSTVNSNVAASYPVGGPYTITWTATDTSGLTATATQSLTIRDTEFPTITAPAAVTTPADAGSCAKALPILGTPVTADNCAISLALSNFNPPYAVGVHTITWFAQDIYGNQTTATQSLTVTDTQNPTISAPATVNAVTDAGICTASGVVLGSPITADNCAISGTVNSGTATYALGSTTVTWTTTDVNGRTASATQLVIVADNQDPTITAPAGITTVTAFGLCTAAPALGTPTTNDNCSVSSTVNNAPAAFPVGATTVVWTVTDGSGRTAVANQVVTVSDDQDPTITAPATFNGNADVGACSAAVVALGSPVTADNCAVSATSNTGSAPYAVGSTTVTWTVTDVNGRSASATQLVIIADNQNPTITAPATVNAVTDAGLCTASGVVLGSATTADNCGVSGTVNNGTATYALGSTTVTWTVTDVNGRTASAAQLVIVADNQDPTISAPAAINVSTSLGLCTASPSLGSPTTNDNCSVSSTVNNAPASFAVGTTTVIWTVTDGSGRSATANQSVTVSDNENPVVTAPATVNVNADSGLCSAASVSLGSATSSDNCGVSSTVNNGSAPYAVGSTTVTWTVTDIYGRTASAAQLVVVADNQNPTITAPAAVSSDTNIGACVATGLALGTPVTADNCAVSSVANNAPASFTIGTVSVIWTVTDVNGRTATASQSVTVSDNQNPSITAPANVNTVTGRGICTASPAIGTAISTDNCAVSSTTNNAPATFPLGTTTVVWTATDTSGRSASANQLVVVVDNQDPTISAPAAITTVTASGLCTASPALGTPVTADNCSVSSTVNNAPAAFPVGSTTVVWTVTDGSGRTATASQSVSVSDNQDPTISAPANVTRGTDAGICTASNVALGSPIVADNCGINATSNNAPRTFALGSTTVTWTTTDVNGRSATAAQSVTINDTELPTLTSPAGFLTNTDAGVCYSTRALGNATFGDNCGVSTTVNNAPAQLPIGATTVTWTVTDVNGNSASALQFVVVADQRAPQFTAAPSPVSVNTTAGLCTANVALSAPAATDNCTLGSVLPNPSSSIFPLGSTTVTWTATDIYGNSATATQSVTVSDAQLPTVSCPANVSQSCELSTAPATTGTATGADNCSVASVNYVDGALTGGTCVNTGTFNRVWTVTDGSGNSASCTQVITRVDATAPVLSMPSNATVQCNSSYLPAVTGSATATDNCDAAPSVTYSDAAPVAGACANSSSVVRTWVATDACGNSSSNTQTISIVDSIAPVISAPSNIIVQCGTSTAPATTGTATATDNCDAAPSVTYSDTSVTTCGSANVLTRTWLATDACGNSSTAVQTISVVDTTPPVVVGPTILTLGLQNGGMPNIVPLVAVNDACGTVTSTQSPAAGSAASLGATTVNLTSTDSCGNSVVTPITVVISGLGANTIDLGYGCGSGVNVMASTFPVIGSDLSITVDTDSPFAFLGLFYDSSAYAGPLFIAPGCGVHIDISVAQPFGIVSTNANGDFSTSLPLPSIPQLLGFNPRMQGIVFSGYSALGSFQLLNGIQLVSGVYAPYVTARAPQFALPTGSGAVLDANYTSSFPTGLVVGAQNFPGNSIGLVALKAFLANPNTQPAQFGGVLGQELAALKVNIALNAAGHLASTNNNLGSVRYRNVQVADAYNGMTLNQIAAAADAAIIAGNAATSSALALVIHQINDAFAGTAPSTFATSYLYNATF